MKNFRNSKFDIAIIGAGVIGCSLARELAKYDLNIVLIEKEEDVAEGISKANSGVIHAGFNVKPNSLKARFNVEGLTLLPEIANELNVKYEICEKFVIAKNDTEKNYLVHLLEQGKVNKVPGLSLIHSKQIKSLEPNVNGKWALLSRNTAIITPYLFTISLAENAVANGVRILFNTKITNIKKNTDNDYLLFSQNKNVCKAKWIINCAGLGADKLSKKSVNKAIEIIPCRGEYFLTDKSAKGILKRAIYPVPPADGAGLGVHLTPTINGNILIGPSAEYIDHKGNTSNTKPILEKLKKEAIELLPAISKYSLIKSFSGIRPKLFKRVNQDKFNDFYIEEDEYNPRFINLLGIESPGFTSAPSIAKYVVEHFISQKEDLKINKNFNGNLPKKYKTSRMDYNELNQLVKNNPLFGEIICRCEMISKGEIIAAINNPLNVKTINGIRKRTHSMLGRCQGGFCFPKICEILINEFSLEPDEIVKYSPESKMLFGYNK